MKYYKVVGVLACLVLIVSCFLPWTYHADVAKNFNGFFSEQNAYGKPGKIFIFLAVCSLLLILTNRIWAKRTHIVISGLLIAYAIKTYILFTSCYNAYCPEKKYGIFLVMVSSILILLASIFPDMKLAPAVPAKVSADNDSVG